METRICAKCCQALLLTAFTRDARTSLGYTYECRECKAARNRDGKDATRAAVEQAFLRRFLLATFVEAHRLGVTVDDIIERFPDDFAGATLGDDVNTPGRKLYRDLEFLIDARPIIKVGDRYYPATAGVWQRDA